MRSKLIEMNVTQKIFR